MARRRNISDLLESRYQCPVSWDAMLGDGSRRFCGECRCEVFDFAQMEPRAVKARLEASRGKLCARLTRVDGRLKMLAPPSLPPAEYPRKTERAPAIAAGLFGAWLGLAAAQASASPDSPALISSPAADPQDDGGGAAPSPAAAGNETELPATFSDTVEVTAQLPPFESVSVGIIVAVEPPTLRELFAASDLVFAGRVGSSEVVAVDDGIAEVRTILRVARRFKGVVVDRFVTYRHSLPVEAFGPELVEAVPELHPGSMVVAFLSLADDDAGRLVFEAAGYSGGLRDYAADELAAYSERLDDLALLHEAAGPEGELDPAGLMEWLVAAAEDPLTRQEDTSQEILSVLEELETVVVSEESEELMKLGAMLTEAHEVRLAAALLATETMADSDLGLFQLVRKVDPESASLWLAATLRLGAIPESGDTFGRLEEFAETLDQETAGAFLGGAKERLDAIDELWQEGLSPEAEEALELERQDLARTLFAELADLLDGIANQGGREE